MQDRHQDRKKYFDEQGITTKKYVIPYINRFMAVNADTRVLEIGCGEGGNLTPFVELGCEVCGIDLNTGQIALAREYFGQLGHSNRATFIAEDIYKIPDQDVKQYDLIMMRDVIEHIHDQDKFMGYVKKFLRPGGLLFIGFPPWMMPFGGHQQICHNKWLSKLPWYHLLPMPIYKWVLRSFGEEARTIEELVEIKETGITIERLRSIAHKHEWEILNETLYLINPNYEIKFGLQPRRQFGPIAAMPWLRNFMTTCGYYIFQKND